MDGFQDSLAAFEQEVHGHKPDEGAVTFAEMIAASNKNEGYIIWLTNPDPRQLESLEILPILPTAETIQRLEGSAYSVEVPGDPNTSATCV